MPIPRSYLVLACADLALTATGGRRTRLLRRLTKPALMPALGVWVSASRGQAEPAMCRRTLTALALSCVGDVALLGEGDRAFLGGLGGFLGAHVAYLAAFHERRGPVWRRESTAKVAPVAAAWLLAVPPIARRAGTLRWPVVGYGTVLAAVQAATLLLDAEVPREARTRLATGATVFLVSDALLGTQRFVVDRSRASRVWDVAVMATYTAAQALLADGVVRLTQRPRAQRS